MWNLEKNSKDDLTCKAEIDKEHSIMSRGFPGDPEDKESACNAVDPCSIPGLGRSPVEGNGNPLQDSCLENPTD